MPCAPRRRSRKKLVEEKITALDGEIAKSRQKWDESFSAKFLVGEENGTEKRPLTDEEKRPRRSWRSRSPRPRLPRWKNCRRRRRK